MAGTATIREVKSLSEAYSDNIPGRSLREVILQVIQLLDLPVEITYHKTKILCRLIGYDPVFRSEAYLPVSGNIPYILIPPSKAPILAVYGGEATQILKIAIKRWKDGEDNITGKDEDEPDWGSR